MQGLLEKIPYERGSKKATKMKWPFEADYGVSTELTREHEMEVDEALEKKNWMKWVGPEESIAPQIQKLNEEFNKKYRPWIVWYFEPVADQNEERFTAKLAELGVNLKDRVIKE